MQCPNCRTPLFEESYESVKIDRCPKCSGTWLDQGELAQILDTKVVEFTAALVTATTASEKAGIPSAEVESIEHCPKCSVPLTAVNYNYASGVILDKCPKNEGIWLNAEELEKVQIHHERWEEKAALEGKNWGKLAKEKAAEAQALHQENIDQTMQKLGTVLFPLLYRLEKSVKKQ